MYMKKKVIKIILLFGTVLLLTFIVRISFDSNYRVHPYYANSKIETEISQTDPEKKESKQYTPSPYENAEYIDDKTFSIIKNVYDKIDFYGTFNQGNVATHDFYKRQFYRLLNGEVNFTERVTGDQYYLKEYDHFSIDDRDGEYDLNNYYYVFFDNDGDDKPELCIRDKASFTYIFNYDVSTDEFSLCQGKYLSYILILGTKKQGLSSYPLNIFFELDQYGEVERFVRFKSDRYTDSYSKKKESCYLVALPEYARESKNVELLESLKESAFLDTEEKNYYFRVTKKQYTELISDFDKAMKMAYYDIENVTYTYEELFGNCMP